MTIKRSIITIFGLSAMLIAFSGIASAQNTQNFTISSFEANYDLTKNSKNISQMQVNEYITANFPSYNQNHGLLRAIPLKYDEADLQLKIVAVDNAQRNSTAGSKNWTYTKSKQNGNEVLKIGDAKIYLHGDQQFHIRYSLANVIKSYPEQDELYWDINGDDWQQTILSTTAKFTLTPEISSATTAYKCYTGKYGSTSQNCEISKQGSEIDAKAIGTLSPGEALTIVVAFKPNTFSIYKQSTASKVLQTALLAMSVAALPLILFVVLLFRWLRYGRDPKIGRSIVAQYEPPHDTSLLLNNFVMHESGSNQAISAQIIDLAIRGYLQVIDLNTSDDNKLGYALKLKKQPTDLPPDQQQTVDMFFGENAAVGTQVNIKDLKYKLAKDITSLNKQIASQAVGQGFFTKNPATTTKKLYGYVSIMMIAGIAMMFFGGLFTIVGINMLACGVILAIFAKAMPAKTIKGAELNNHMHGLELYIKMAEQDRIRFHQSPENAERTRASIGDPTHNVKLFESLLPYAMLFGMEKQWGKQFEDIYSQPPDWYNSSNMNFQTLYFVNNWGDFSGQVNSSFSSPSSSNSSGFSAGGGFSGGGGGGGGGGGW